MKQIITAGSTGVRQVIFVVNTAGTGVTGITNASSGLTWYWYSNTNGTSSAVSVVGETLGTWTSGGFIQIDATNLPGFYEIGVPNALFASSVQWSVMEIFGVTGMIPVTVEFEVIQQNLQGTLTATVPSLSTNVNVQQWLGTAVTSNAGIPIVDVAAGTITTVTGTVTATVPGAGGTNVNVVQWNGASVATPNVAGVPKVDVVDWLGTAVTSSGGTPIVVATNTQPVNVIQWLGTAVTSSAGVPVTTNLGTITATVPSAVTVTGTVTATVPSVVSANVTEWLGTAVTSNAGVPIVDVAAGTVTTVTGNVNGTVAAVTTCTGVGTVTNISGTFPANVVQWLGTAVTSNAGVPLVDVNGITGTVTATVVGGTIATVTNPVSISAGQLTVKKDTALTGFTFPMYNSTSGNPATGLSVSCTRSIDGGGLSAASNSPSEVGSGIYTINLSASDLNGGVITLVFVASSASATIITLITQT